MIKLFDPDNYVIDTSKFTNLLHGDVVEEFENSGFSNRDKQSFLKWIESKVSSKKSKSKSKSKSKVGGRSRKNKKRRRSRKNKRRYVSSRKK